MYLPFLFSFASSGFLETVHRGTVNKSPRTRTLLMYIFGRDWCVRVFQFAMFTTECIHHAHVYVQICMKVCALKKNATKKTYDSSVFVAPFL